MKNELEKSKVTLEKYIKDLEAKNDEYNELEANCNNDELENELEQSKVTLEKYIKDLEAKNNEYNELEVNCKNDKYELEKSKVILEKYMKNLVAKNDEYYKLKSKCNNNANLQEKLSKTQQELIDLKINFAKKWKELSYKYNRIGSEINRIVYENRKLNSIISSKQNCNT